jgi:hypothetical protein
MDNGVCEEGIEGVIEDDTPKYFSLTLDHAFLGGSGTAFDMMSTNLLRYCRDNQIQIAPRYEDFVASLRPEQQESLKSMVKGIVLTELTRYEDICEARTHLDACV